MTSVLEREDMVGVPGRTGRGGQGVWGVFWFGPFVYPKSTHPSS